MSIGRIILGISGLGSTAVGVWFGISKRKENDVYKAKITTFRKIAAQVNQYLASEDTYKNLSLPDPEHPVWEKKFIQYSSLKWNDRDKKSQTIPLEFRKDATAFRDYCFKRVKENVEDVKNENMNLVYGDIQGKEFWEQCLETELGIKQLLQG